FLGWYPYAVRAGRRLLSEEKFDAVLTTAPPFTVHWIGRALRKGGGPPWIADFRDAWTKMPGYDHNALQLAIERPMEKSVLRRANHVLATTEPTAREFLEIDPSLAGKISTIPNGYDPAAYECLPPYQKGQRLRLAFTGTRFFGQDVGKFLESLNGWASGRRRDEIRLAYAGPDSADLKAAAKNTPAGELLETQGYLSHGATAAFQRQSDVLVLPLYDDFSSHRFLPGKLFEYLASGRPILCIANPGSESAKIVSRAKAGWVVSPGDETALRERLDKIWSDWEAGRLETSSDAAWIEENFSRPRQTARLAQILSMVSKVS
ncbi:MAG: glycosyltransferase, partial [Bdellovibrionota bacterium]